MKTIIAQLILTENKIICAISHANRYSARAENTIKLKIPMTRITINCRVCAVCPRTWDPPILKIEH
jgi:hypothetical protein